MHSLVFNVLIDYSNNIRLAFPGQGGSVGGAAVSFNEFALAHEPGIRLGAFFGIFALMAIWEAAAPRRSASSH
jgi:hypothetical protein